MGRLDAASCIPGAKHASSRLLCQGFRVRTTMRNLSREAEVRTMIGSQVDAGDRLVFFAANLLSDAGWALAVEGCNYVMHAASPMPGGEYRGQDLITPARAGTRRVLEVAWRAGVRRVVLTSSAAAALPAIGESGVIDETRWTERPDKSVYQYLRAKTLAERDAWSFVRDGGGAMELATVLPTMIQGPVMGAHFSSAASWECCCAGGCPLLHGLVSISSMCGIRPTPACDAFA
jgi:dihydroflavonol-4-reductase